MEENKEKKIGIRPPLTPTLSLSRAFPRLEQLPPVSNLRCDTLEGDYAYINSDKSICGPLCCPEGPEYVECLYDLKIKYPGQPLAVLEGHNRGFDFEELVPGKIHYIWVRAVQPCPPPGRCRPSKWTKLRFLAPKPGYCFPVASKASVVDSAEPSPREFIDDAYDRF